MTVSLSISTYERGLVSMNAHAGIESPKQVSDNLWVMGTPSDAQLSEFAKMVVRWLLICCLKKK